MVQCQGLPLAFLSLHTTYFLFLPQLLPTAYPTRRTATRLPRNRPSPSSCTYWAATQSHCHSLSLKSWQLHPRPPASGYWLLTDARVCPRPRANTPVYASCISGYEAGATGVLRVWGHKSVLRRFAYFQLEASNKFCTSIKNANDRRYVDRFINAHKSYCSA